MTIRPVQNPNSDMWEVLQRDAIGQTFPLPGGMRFRTATKAEANNKLYSVAEQLGSLGFQVAIEEVD